MASIVLKHSILMIFVVVLGNFGDIYGQDVSFPTDEYPIDYDDTLVDNENKENNENIANNVQIDLSNEPLQYVFGTLRRAKHRLSTISQSFLGNALTIKNHECKSPFQSYSTDTYFKGILTGIFKCPYNPIKNLLSPESIGTFVRYFYMTSGQETYEEVMASDMNQLIDPNYPNYIIIHGFKDGVRSGDWMEMIGKKIVTDQNANVILMDYQVLSSCSYLFMATMILHKLGEYLAGSIINWEMNLDKTRLIGHSLGSHVAGIAGTVLMKKTGDQLAHIDGLDPASPIYENQIPFIFEKRLNPSCAKFVQVLHTSNYLGAQKQLGHSDFYANRNNSPECTDNQPGCILDTCNHTRAKELFYASLFEEYIFMGTECNGNGEKSRFGFFNDGKVGCFTFNTTACFGYSEPI